MAIGLTLMALVYVSKNISGAHFNPAVSLAFFLKRELSVGPFFGYLLSQITGGILAALALNFLTGSVFYVEPPSTTSIYQQAFSEVFFTLLFVMLMLIFVLTNTHRKSKISGLAIGLTFTGMLMIATPISGGVLNPAISIGPALIDFMSSGGSYRFIPLYTIAPMAGAAIAALLFNVFYAERGSLK